MGYLIALLIVLAGLACFVMIVRADAKDAESYDEWLQRPEHIWNQGKSDDNEDQ